MVNRQECQHLLGQLSDYVDGELEQTMCEEIEHHLADCQNCRIVVDTLSKTVALYRTQGQDPLPGNVQERLYKVLKLENLIHPTTESQSSPASRSTQRRTRSHGDANLARE
jgi:anti-sigma factor RsiW